MRGNLKSAQIRLLGLLLLFLITASGVFAYSAEKSHPAKPAISVETALKAIDFAAENDISIDSEFSANLRQSINFNRNRYYSPALGRFTSKDPIGFNGGMNLYRYADNNPMRWVDPWGLLTSGQAFWHYLGHPQLDDYGNIAFPGENLRMSFNDIDTSNVDITESQGIWSYISKTYCEDEEIQIGNKKEDYISFQTRGDQALMLGNLTLKPIGILYLRKNGTWEFKGELRCFDDPYDFNKAKRAMAAEGLTTVGRLIGGTDYYIEIRGEKEFNWSGDLPVTNRKQRANGFYY